MDDVVKKFMELLEEAEEHIATEEEYGERLRLVLEKKFTEIRHELEIRTCEPGPEYVKITRNEYNRSRRRDHAVEQFIFNYKDKAL